MLRWIRLAVVVLTVLVLAACGRGGLNAYKELGVSDKDVPGYEVTSEVTDTSPPTQIWSSVSAKNVDESQAKQILADYINKKLVEQKNTIRGIMVTLKEKKNQYTAYYVKDEQALKTIGPSLEKPGKFPAVIYSKDK